jgi:hypothetical protein
MELILAGKGRVGEVGVAPALAAVDRPVIRRSKAKENPAAKARHEEPHTAACITILNLL